MNWPFNWSNPDPIILKAIRLKYPHTNLSEFSNYTRYGRYDFLRDCGAAYGLISASGDVDFLNTATDLSSAQAICQGVKTMDNVLFWIGLCLGIPGNILALITILRMARSTGTFYVALLAVSDLFTLIMKSVIHVMEEYKAENDISCKVNHFLSSFAGAYANWVLVLICFERFVTIRFPLKKSYYFTMRRAKLSAVLLVVFLAPLYVFYLFLNTYEITRCATTEIGSIMTTVSTVFYSYLPTILMVVMVTAIAVEIKKIQKNRKSIFGGSERSAQAQSNLATQQKLKEQAKVERSITAMLVVASVVFIILTFPICLMIPIAYYSGASEVSVLKLAKIHMAFRITTYLVLLSHGVNFFLYFVSAGRFRAKLFSLLRCSRAADGTTQDQSANTMEETL